MGGGVVLTNFIVAIISQYIHVSNCHIVYLTLTHYVNYSSIKLEKNIYPGVSITQWQITDSPGCVPLRESRDGIRVQV